MTEREREHDHGDDPITLEEIRESLLAHPFSVRVRTRRGFRRVRWSLDFEPPPHSIRPLWWIRRLVER